MPGNPVVDPSRRWFALGLLCVAQFVDVLGVTVVIVALPSIQGDLALTETELQWVVSVYALFFAGFLILAGRAADLFGRRRLFVAGLALFSLASLVCGLASSGSVLIVARAAQGLGAAIVVPAALSLLTVSFPAGTERYRALAIWTATAAGGGAAGFFLGGVLTDAFGWQAVFLVNVPVGIASLSLTPLLLAGGDRAASALPLDMAGALSVTAGLLVLVFGLTLAQEAGITASSTLGALAASGMVLTCFAWIESRVRAPLVPLSRLRNPGLAGACLVAVSLTATTSAAAVLNTLWLQDVRGVSPTTTGLIFAPFSLCVIVGSAAGARLMRRFGPRATATLGLWAVAGAMLMLLGISADGGVGFLLASLAVSGTGLGSASVAATSAGTGALVADEQGLASGLVNTATQLGHALGIALLVTIASARTEAVVGNGSMAAARVDGFEWGFAFAALMAAGGAIAASTLLRAR